MKIRWALKRFFTPGYLGKPLNIMAQKRSTRSTGKNETKTHVGVDVCSQFVPELQNYLATTQLLCLFICTQFTPGQQAAKIPFN